MFSEPESQRLVANETFTVGVFALLIFGIFDNFKWESNTIERDAGLLSDKRSLGFKYSAQAVNCIVSQNLP